MRQYVYISERKLQALDVPQDRRFFSRVRKVNLSAGSIGAGAELAGADQPTLVARLAASERAIRKTAAVRDAVDPGLAPGQWFAAESLEMAYGVQQFGDDGQSDAAVFAADTNGVRLLLSGSVQFLLDRQVPIDNAGNSMSSPQTIGDLLASLTEDSQLGVLDAQSMDAYAAANLYQTFSRYGLQPMSFLARAIKVGTSTWDPTSRLVLGTPLFVAISEPK